MSVEWTDELRAQVIKEYKEAEPTAETSTEIVKEIATKVGMTVNGVRAVLVRAEVYIKKDATKAAAGGSKPASTRVDKASSISKLNELISNNSLTLDEDITSKLTGKAANYFVTIFEALTIKEA